MNTQTGTHLLDSDSLHNPANQKLFWGLLILVPAAIYFQVLGFGFVSIDDGVHILNNPHFHPVTSAGIGQFWRAPFEGLYIPVTYSVWGLHVALSQWLSPFLGEGLLPRLLHTSNLCLHIANTVLVFLLVRRFISNGAASLLGALIFAIHPIQVEAVAWISAMKDLLSTFFSLMALWLYCLFASPNLSINSSRRKFTGLFYVLATVSLLLGILSKPAVIMIPALAFVLDFFLLKRGIRAAVLPIGFWTLLLIPFALLAKQAQPDILINFVTPYWLRPFVAADSVLFYLYKLVLPWNLVLDYGRAPQVVLARTATYLSILVLLAIALLLWKLKDRITTAAFLLFVLALIPVMGWVPFLFQNYSTVADRFAYLSLLGPSLLLARLTSVIRAPMWVSIPLLGLMAVKTTFQTALWKDEAKLYSHSIKVQPDNFLAHANLATLMLKKRKLDRAIHHYRQALNLKPHQAPFFESVHLSLGQALEHLGENGKAAQHYAEAIRLFPLEAESHNRLGTLYARGGYLDEAISLFERAQQIDPQHRDSYRNLLTAKQEKWELAQNAEK